MKDIPIMKKNKYLLVYFYHLKFNNSLKYPDVRPTYKKLIKLTKNIRELTKKIIEP